MEIFFLAATSVIALSVCQFQCMFIFHSFHFIHTRTRWMITFVASLSIQNILGYIEFEVLLHYIWNCWCIVCWKSVWFYTKQSKPKLDSFARICVWPRTRFLFVFYQLVLFFWNMPCTRVLCAFTAIQWWWYGW